MSGVRELVTMSAALCLVGCGERAGDDAVTTDSAATTTAAAPQLTDGNIHQAELSFAATARSSASSDAVKEYTTRMIEEHGANLELLNRYADAARDEDLRALIRKTIPELRLQQDRAIDILRGL